MPGPYDQSHNQRPRNAFEAHLNAPFKRAVDKIRNRVNDVARRLGNPAFLNQYPGNAVPYIFSKTYQFDLVAPRRNGVVGFDGLAPVVDLGAFVLPRNGNIFVGRDGPFYWCSTNISGYYSLTYDADPGFGVNTFINTLPVSDIFNRAIEENGGALQVNYFFGHVDNDDKANIAFDIELYDRKRGRRLHEERLPPQVLTAQGYANKETSNPVRFNVNSEIEPRIRLLEVRPGSLLNTDQAFNAAQFRAYLNFTFKGYKVLEV